MQGDGFDEKVIPLLRVFGEGLVAVSGGGWRVMSYADVLEATKRMLGFHVQP